MKALLAVALILMAVTPAQASMCAPRKDMLAALGGKHKESVKAMGVAGQGLMETFASKAGTWTIIVTTPQGMSCMIAAGNSFEILPKELEEQDL